MTPTALKTYLDRILKQNIMFSTMIWGPPGIGKSSIVGQLAQANDLAFTDVRLSQLAPTDLRGLPVAENGISKWYPPEFLPRSGKGILFLDEINMAPPTMQGMAQQLILDRCVGSYQVPDGWFIWAAGNRKEDRASVFDMPALETNVHEQIIAFLSFRSTLLHKIDPQQPAWPSPRSWVIASGLHQVGLDIAPAVGEGAATEFLAYTKLYSALPDLLAILAGNGDRINFPAEPSARYATAIGLTIRAQDAQQAYNAFTWLSRVATPEWVQLFAVDLFQVMRSKGQMGVLAQLVQKDASLQKFLKDFQQLIGM
jgi:hypothetical protein